MQAEQVIQQLTATETELRKTKRRLRKKRDGFLRSIALTGGMNTEQILTDIEHISLDVPEPSSAASQSEAFAGHDVMFLFV